VGHELVGGQALVEGVMIRQGPRWAAAARRPDGSIATTTRHAAPAFAATRGIPVVRGIGALVDSVRIGLAAMRWSREETIDPTSADAAPVGGARERVVVLGVVAGVLAAFLLVPLAIAALARPVVGTGWGAAVVEGLVRLALFVAYLAMLSTLPGVRRTLEYHGAEHMVIAAFEHAEPLTIEAARRYSTRHARCGTDFLLLVVVVAIVVFSFVGQASWPVLVLTRVLGLPLVAGLAYEILRLAKRRPDSRFVRAITAPGLALQALTTKPPADDQIEVAIASLEAVLAAEVAAGVSHSTTA